MEKIFLALFFLISFNVKADQKMWLTLEEANYTVNFLKKQSHIIDYCACCDDNPNEILIMNVHYEEIKQSKNLQSSLLNKQKYYYVFVSGIDSNGQRYYEKIDLAYIYIPMGDKAVNLGLELGFNIDPCGKPNLPLYDSSNLEKENILSNSDRFFETISLCSNMENLSATKGERLIFDTILDEVGLKSNFTIRPCEGINNAVALTVNGERIVLYDRNFVQSLAEENIYRRYFIMAHEIGHHLNGHTVDITMFSSSIDSKMALLEKMRSQELEADEFAGFVMSKLTIPSTAIQILLKELPDSEFKFSTHPNQKERIIAFQRGYDKSEKQKNRKTSVERIRPTDTYEVYNDDIYEIMSALFYKANEANELNNYESAIQLLDEAIKLASNELYFSPKPDLFLETAFHNRAWNNYRLGNQEQAIRDMQESIEYLKVPKTLYALARLLFQYERYDEACAALTESMRFFDQENEHSYSLDNENLPKIMTLISKTCNRDD